uniref:Cytochrome b6 n=1 Tax=Solanum tuberosum TaxID=4113 RepID=M1BPN1_SOLTU
MYFVCISPADLKKPRELTWVTGVVLAVLTASFGVTGYSLPWDQIGYWAVKIVTGVPDAIPVIGSIEKGSISFLTVSREEMGNMLNII